MEEIKIKGRLNDTLYVGKIRLSIGEAQYKNFYRFSMFDYNEMCSCKFDLDKDGIKLLIKELQKMIKE